MNDRVDPLTLLGVETVPTDISAFLAERRREIRARNATIARTRRVREISAIYLAKNGKIDLARIATVVSEDYDMDSSEIYKRMTAFSPGRFPSKIVCYMAREFLDYSPRRIAFALKYSLTTVDRKLSEIRHEIKESPVLIERINRLKKELCLE